MLNRKTCATLLSVACVACLTGCNYKGNQPLVAAESVKTEPAQVFSPVFSFDLSTADIARNVAATLRDENHRFNFVELGIKFIEGEVVTDGRVYMAPDKFKSVAWNEDGLLLVAVMNPDSVVQEADRDGYVVETKVPFPHGKESFSIDGLNGCQLQDLLCRMFWVPPWDAFNPVLPSANGAGLYAGMDESVAKSGYNSMDKAYQWARHIRNGKRWFAEEAKILKSGAPPCYVVREEIPFGESMDVNVYYAREVSSGVWFLVKRALTQADSEIPRIYEYTWKPHTSGPPDKFVWGIDEEVKSAAQKKLAAN